MFRINPKCYALSKPTTSIETFYTEAGGMGSMNEVNGMLRYHNQVNVWGSDGVGYIGRVWVWVFYWNC